MVGYGGVWGCRLSWDFYFSFRIGFGIFVADGCVLNFFRVQQRIVYFQGLRWDLGVSFILVLLKEVSWEQRMLVLIYGGRVCCFVFWVLLFRVICFFILEYKQVFFVWWIKYLLVVLVQCFQQKVWVLELDFLGIYFGLVFY